MRTLLPVLPRRLHCIYETPARLLFQRSPAGYWYGAVEGREGEVGWQGLVFWYAFAAFACLVHSALLKTKTLLSSACTSTLNDGTYCGV